MRILTLLAFITSSAIQASAAHVQSYEFSTTEFQLGSWRPSTLSYDAGLSKIRSLDKWFNSLSEAERGEQYAIHRNRLFIVTQERRLEREILPTLKRIALRDENVLAAQRDYSQHLKLIQVTRDRLLDSPDLLKTAVFKSFSDATDEAKNAGADIVIGGKSLFSAGHVSKGGGGGGSLIGGASSYSMPRSRDLLDRRDQYDFEKSMKSLEEGLRLKRHGLSKPVCANPSGSLGEDFDSNKSPETSRFLKELGVPRELSKEKSKDLSSWFPKPESQWFSEDGHTNDCVGHAIASDVSSALYRTKNIKLGSLIRSNGVSPQHLYAVASTSESQPSTAIDTKREGYCDANSYQADPMNGISSMNETLKALKTIPLCQNSAAAHIKTKYQIEKFSAAEFSPNDRKPSFEFFKALIDSGQPPIVQIDSVDRLESGDWLKIKPPGNGYSRVRKHVLNIVGYDEAVDPLTLCTSKVFKVRDSLGKKKIEYMISADNLIEHLQGVYRSSKVVEAESNTSPPSRLQSAPVSR